MEQRSTDRVQRHRDALAGSKPALYLALGIGVITGGAVTLAMVATALLIGAVGGLGSGASGLFAMLGVSVAFWLGASLGVILGVSAGFRVWVALYPAYERRSAEAEQRAAVDQVESWLRRPGPPHEG
jgi:hypothetical protein